MRVELNGEARDVAEPCTVADVDAAAGADPLRRGIAVAVEGEVVPQSAWERTVLTAGQRVEVLEARQGG